MLLTVKESLDAIGGGDEKHQIDFKKLRINARIYKYNQSPALSKPASSSP